MRRFDFIRLPPYNVGVGHHHEGHNHAHSHAGHSHGPKDFGPVFAIGAALNAGFVILEVTFGLTAHSLALLSDAGHNLGDVLTLLLGWGASVLVKAKPKGKYTYGYRRSSILVALFNAMVLLIITGAIALEAVRHLLHPEHVAGLTVTWVAAVGIAVNLATALLFITGQKEDLNARGAFLHMAADAGTAFGVVLSGLLIWKTGQAWIDPVASLVVSAVIVGGTWGVLRDSFNLAMDSIPEGIDLHEVEHCLRSLPGILDVHHVHIWGMSTTQVALTAHLVKADDMLDNLLLGQIETGLSEKFHIEHVTIQLEETSKAGASCLAHTC